MNDRNQIPQDPGDDHTNWNQDENALRGLPPEEDLPQEGAFDDSAMPDEVLARYAKAYELAIARERASFEHVERRRQAFLSAVRDRARPATPTRICEVLQRVLTSENARALEIANDTLRLMARIAVTEGQEQLPLVRAALSRLSSAPYQTTGYDRLTLEGAATLMRRCYFPREAEGDQASTRSGKEGAA